MPDYLQWVQVLSGHCCLLCVDGSFLYQHFLQSTPCEKKKQHVSRSDMKGEAQRGPSGVVL